MTLSAAFTVDGNANPAAHEVTYGATVTLERTSLQGTATWSVLSGSKSDMTLPTLSVAATGNTATFTMVSDPSDGLGRTVLVKCSVQDGRTTAVEYAVIGVPNVAGLVPVANGEEKYRDATYGWTDTLNAALAGIRSGSWINYTPTLTAASGSPDIGNGTLDAYYRLVGNTIELNLQLGIGSGTTLGNGTLTFSLPGDYVINGSALPAGGIGEIPIIGSGVLQDSSTPSNNVALTVYRGGDDAKIQVIPSGSITPVSSTAPFTMATGDALWIGAIIPVTLGV